MSSRSWRSWIRVLLADVLEVGAQHRVERLGDQLLDVAEALDDLRGLLVVDVDDHRQRQHRLVGVLGHQVDGEALVVAVGSGLPGIQCRTKLVVGTRMTLPA